MIDNVTYFKTKAVEMAAQAFAVEPVEITDITVLKRGMTNHSFLFQYKGKKYIVRVPGEGTEKLINRCQEAEVYQAIIDKDISDKIIYFNAESGYKITEYLENVRICNPFEAEDVKRCMERLRAFHEMKLYVGHEFDLFEQMEFYESLWQGRPSVYPDYVKTKKAVYELKDYIEGQPKEIVLAHIDSVPDNFLFTKDDEVKLIDWEYAGMQDPHVDIAMFAVYSFYDKKQIDALMEMYFGGNTEDAIRIKIYCYIAVCGLLWSNWSEYKRQMGVDFGEYSVRQYRYAKEFYDVAKEEMKCLGALEN